MRGRTAASWLAACVVFGAALVLGSATAEAQTRRTPPRPIRPPRPAPHAGSWELSGGFLWQGGFDLGDRAAELTRNPSTGTGPFDLFGSASSLGAGIGAQGRIAGYVSRNLAIEAGARLTRPTLNIDLSGDAESAPNLTASETLTQYVFDGSVVWHFAPFHKGRAVPYLAGGAGYIRDLHEGNALIETGAEYHVMGGLKWWLSSRPRRLGIRGEAGISIRDGGFDFREGRRTVPVASASLVYLF
ncbi:MAG: hypothetical protein ABIX28_24910 [Vicinamibacterales bacterium]